MRIHLRSEQYTLNGPEVFVMHTDSDEESVVWSLFQLIEKKLSAGTYLSPIEHEQYLKNSLPSELALRGIFRSSDEKVVQDATTLTLRIKRERDFKDHYKLYYGVDVYAPASSGTKASCSKHTTEQIAIPKCP